MYNQKWCFKGFSNRQLEELIEKYWHFIENSPYEEYEAKVIDAYQKAIRRAVGAPAPDFTLRDNLDRLVSLSSYHGQIVYLNFWASWCRPCMSKNV